MTNKELRIIINGREHGQLYNILINKPDGTCEQLPNQYKHEVIQLLQRLLNDHIK